ncbi:MAG: HD-GYP domain-containing protein [bacterium]
MLNKLATGDKDKTIFNIDLNIKIEEFVKFYFKIVNRTLNHLGKHSENTQIVSTALAETLRIKSSDKKLLKYGALLHDIGKLFVPAEILNSSSTLNKIEFEIIKTHTVSGWDALDNFTTLPNEIKIFALKHHYRNGFGYPKQIMYKNDIDPLLVDILTIADSFSAIMEPRVYKKPVLESEAFLIISDSENEKNAGLNPNILDKLKYLIDNQKIIMNSFF